MKCCRWRTISGDKPGVCLLALVVFILAEAWVAPVALSQENTMAVSSQDIMRLVTRYIMDHTPSERRQVQVTNLNIQGDLQVPRGQLSYEIMPRASQLMPGPVSFTVVVRVDGKPVRRLLATGRLEVMARVVVAAYPLAPRHLITEADIQVEERHLAQLPEGTATDPHEVVGKRTRRGVAAGNVLSMGLLEAPPVIKRGAVVTIVAQSPWITVIAQGQAKADGAQGEQIRVVNLASRKEIYARVVDENTVRVDF